MDIQIKQIDNIIIAHISGELNQKTSPALQERLIPLIQPDCKILLEMSNLSYLSSAGLRILLLLYRQINAGQGQVVLAGLTEMVEDTMSITGFLTFFTAYKTLDEGIAALRHNLIT